jgi:hypothetical protein
MFAVVQTEPVDAQDTASECLGFESVLQAIVREVMIWLQQCHILS